MVRVNLCNVPKTKVNMSVVWSVCVWVGGCVSVSLDPVGSEGMNSGTPKMFSSAVSQLCFVCLICICAYMHVCLCVCVCACAWMQNCDCPPVLCIMNVCKSVFAYFCLFAFIGLHTLCICVCVQSYV